MRIVISDGRAAGNDGLIFLPRLMRGEFFEIYLQAAAGANPRLRMFLVYEEAFGQACLLLVVVYDFIVGVIVFAAARRFTARILTAAGAARTGVLTGLLIRLAV